MDENKLTLRAGIAMVAPRTFWTGAPMARVAGAPAAKDPPYLIQDGIGLIRIAGVMEKNAPDFVTWVADTAKKTQAVAQAVADPKVKAIMLSVDSPGGYADGVLELGDAINQARAIKPVIAQVDGMAASAAYWVASQASQVYLGPMDMVGSIGVYSLVLDDSKMVEEMGFKVYLVSSGGLKGAGEIGQEISKEYLAEVEKIVTTINGFFLDAVARGRRMERAAVEKLNDGRVHIGEAAVKLGLADGVQSMPQTFMNLRAAIQGPGVRDRALARDLTLAKAELGLAARTSRAK